MEFEDCFLQSFFFREYSTFPQSSGQALFCVDMNKDIADLSASCHSAFSELHPQNWQCQRIQWLMGLGDSPPLGGHLGDFNVFYPLHSYIQDEEGKKSPLILGITSLLYRGREARYSQVSNLVSYLSNIS